jgi:hypothetical protein
VPIMLNMEPPDEGCFCSPDYFSELGNDGSPDPCKLKSWSANRRLAGSSQNEDTFAEWRSIDGA